MFLFLFCSEQFVNSLCECIHNSACFYSELFDYCVPLRPHSRTCLLFCRLKAANCTDTRVQMMNDIITGIRVIKMYAWENAFKKVISDVRG